mgnify:CR=1 FL=1
MTVKPILTEPNKLLRQISKPVKSVGDDERKHMDDMLDTMYAAPGIGLAAIQIRSEEHTSELQSLAYLVCRLLLEKQKYNRSGKYCRMSKH